jgi:hypothetical protein
MRKIRSEKVLKFDEDDIKSQKKTGIRLPPVEMHDSS